MTKIYAVIGDPIDHSLSPTIHNAVFKKLDLDCSYIAYKVSKNELAEGVESLKNINIAGFNITIPHKIEMVKYLDSMDENCSLSRACNTVLNVDGRFKGFNTDIDGFLLPLLSRKISIKKMSILLLGAGGAARAVVCGLAKHNLDNLTIANKTKTNAEILSKFAKQIGMKTDILPLNNVSAKGFDLIINASALGLANEPSLVKNDTIQKNAIVYDIVYKPMNTSLIKQAKQAKASIIYGYEMLLCQAIKSFEIWHGVKAPYDVMKRALLGVPF